MWGLWNEGNLFSLSVAELAAFLEEQNPGSSVPSDGSTAPLKKTALVRRVEDIMSHENPSTFGNPSVLPDTVAAISKEHAQAAGLISAAAAAAAAGGGGGPSLPHGSTVIAGALFKHNLHHSFDEADYYCDWQQGLDTSTTLFSGSGSSATTHSAVDPTTGLLRIGKVMSMTAAAAEIDFIAFDAPGEIKAWLEVGHDTSTHLSSKGYQLLHETSTGDVVLARLRGVENLPGCAELATAPPPADASSSSAELGKPEQKSGNTRSGNNNIEQEEDADADIEEEEEDDDAEDRTPVFYTVVSHGSPKAAAFYGSDDGPTASAAAVANLILSAPGDDASTNALNKVRFRRAFHWAVSSAWSNNREAEINIGAGRVLLWHVAAKNDHTIFPIWTCQQHLHDLHPYAWFAVSHDSAVADIENFAVNSLKMKPENFVASPSSSSSSSSRSHSGGVSEQQQQGEVSFKVTLRANKGTKMWIEAECNSRFETTHVYRPWFRYLTTHFLRTTMPDLRFLLRARNLMSGKDTEPFMQAQLIKYAPTAAEAAAAAAAAAERPDAAHLQHLFLPAATPVVSVLSPDLGDVVYACHRVIRRWSTKMGRGSRISLVETRRTPLLVTHADDTVERVEYELIATIPRPEDGVDIGQMAEELWDKGSMLATVLEKSSEKLLSYPVNRAGTFL